MSDQLLNDLNPAQQQAVTFGTGPLLILAGAGSGKTRCLTYRVAWLISEQLINPGRALLLTFTNKAAAEMKSRVQRLLTVNDSQLAVNTLPWAGTFHSWCAWTLRRLAGPAGLPANWVIYDEDDKCSLLKEIISDLKLDPKRFKPRPIAAAISDAKNELISAVEYPQYVRGEWGETISQIYLEYYRRLNKFGALDFDDLLLRAVQLFNRQPDILAGFQQQIQYLLVDEYQDTNSAQYQLTRQLIGKNHNLTAVGDFSQAIYQFRGANFRNLMNLKNDFPDLTEIRLEQNYRSHQGILDAAHNIIRHNREHPILKLWTDRQSADRPRLFTAASELEEAKFIVSQLYPPYRDFAILYRTNAQSRVFEEALLSAGIPYILIGAIRFYQRAEIKDCLSYLRLIFNPHDKVSETRIIKLGKKRYSNFQIFRDAKLVNLRREHAADGGNPPVYPGVTANKQISPTSSSIKLSTPTLELLDSILSATKYLERFDPADPEDQARLENIRELRSVAQTYPDLSRFLEQVALVEKEALIKDHDSDLVTLMTLHAAKGLEFPNVFITGLEEGLLPHSRSLMKTEDVEEERRLMYVGVTRAMNKLYLTHARSRLFYGVRGVCVPSRFISEIGEDLLEKV